MSGYAAYISALNEELSRLKLSCRPSCMLDRWQALLDDCCEGYSGSLYEFENEIDIRNHIELLMQSKALRPFPDFTFFGSEISRIDTEFKKHLVLDISVAGPVMWWENCLPAGATSKFIAEAGVFYGTEAVAGIARID